MDKHKNIKDMDSEGKQTLLIIDCENAHNAVLKNVALKAEIKTLTGAYALAYIPMSGEVSINNFREEGQFQFAPVMLKINGEGAVYALPVEFIGIQGRATNEEIFCNRDKQILLKPVAVNREVPENATLHIKHSNTDNEFNFRYNLKVILRYTER